MNPYDPPQADPPPAVSLKASLLTRCMVLAVPFAAGELTMYAWLAARRGERLFPAMFAVVVAVMMAIAWRWTRWSVQSKSLNSATAGAGRG